jgi:hypothetical protein
LHQSQLVLRAGAREDVDAGNDAAQLPVVQHLDLGAGESGPAGTDAELRTDRPSSLDVIAGDHLHADACVVALAHRLRCLGAWRIASAQDRPSDGSVRRRRTTSATGITCQSACVASVDSAIRSLLTVLFDEVEVTFVQPQDARCRVSDGSSPNMRR